MRTVSIFKNGNNRAIRLPRELDFEGVSEARNNPGRKQHYPASCPAYLELIPRSRKGRSGLYGGA